jgi:hypothetical protein
MPKIYMRTYGQTAGFGDPFTSEMGTAVLELTPELIALCRQRARLALDMAAQDANLWEVLFWDPGSITWWEFYPDYLTELLGLVEAEDCGH